MGGKEEKQILNDGLVHVEKSLECVRELKNGLEAFYHNDQEGKNKAIAKVKEAEHQGDEVRKKMMEELSRGLLLPPDREDLMFLNEYLNDIADGAKEVARLLEFMNEPIMSELSRELLEDSLLAVKAGEKLQDAIASLIANNLSKVLEDCAQIETLEENGDDKKRELLGSLLKANLVGPTMLMVYEIINGVEEVLDSIDAAGDLMRILAIKAH